jgi:predicted AlkP superfamily pyrophosphatase or phosphodiesterase
MPLIRRALIVSYDGLRPDAIAQAPMPNLQALMQAGAYSLTAQTTFPSATLPGHASMLTGMCPQKHGVDWNDYNPAQGFAQGVDIFDLAHAAGLKTVMVVGKQKLIQLTEPGSLDVYKYINDRDLVIADWILENFPADFGLMFVHFPTIDSMGHEHGWLSWEQLSVARRGDEALGKLLATLDERGMRQETIILITADHGGHDQTHGSRNPLDMTIPWVLSGPGIRSGELASQVQITDTAATVAWALKLPIPPEWDGAPVTEAFGLPLQPRPMLCP